MKRRSSSFNTGRIEHFYEVPNDEHPRFRIHYGDLADSTNLIRIIQEKQPTEIYNLAAQTHVQVSFETPEYTADADGTGTLRILEAICIVGLAGRLCAGDRRDATRVADDGGWRCPAGNSWLAIAAW